MNNILINGKEKKSINVNDRGLQYGDGIFETMAVRSGKITLWQDHWQRLVLGCDRLSIEIPNKELIEKEIKHLCDSKSEPQFIIKLIITRGEGSRGYHFTEKQTSTRILSTHDWPDHPESHQINGVVIRYCDTTLSENMALAGIKHLNRLEQVLARNEWNTDDFQEGLMLTRQGHIVDGTMSNIFVVQDNMLFTPDLSLCGVSGVMRKTIISIAKELGYLVYEKDFTKNELEDADVLFLTNSIFGIWPIKSISNTLFYKVGKMTLHIQEELESRLI